MAKISIHQFLHDIRGKVDGLVVRKIRGQYFLGRKPKPRGKYKPTSSQARHQNRFKLASEYAKGVQRNAELRAFYAPFANKFELRIRAVAMSDFFEVPTVNAIDLAEYRGRAGDTLRIRATDKFGVIRLAVELRDAAGARLEGGDAVADEKFWRYTAQTSLAGHQAITIEVKAYDRPGNIGELQATWPEASETAADK
jgi:hypothetical protein